MRLFIALSAPENARQALEMTQRVLRRQGVRGRFTLPDDLHMTLTFLGDGKEPAPVIEVMRGIEPARTELVFDRLTMFGNILVALFRSDDAAQGYVRALRKALDEAGIGFDRKAFRPHITLCRDAAFPSSLKLEACGDPLRGVGIPTQQVHLMRTAPQGKTPRYSVIFTKE